MGTNYLDQGYALVIAIVGLALNTITTPWAFNFINQNATGTTWDIEMGALFLWVLTSIFLAPLVCALGLQTRVSLFSLIKAFVCFIVFMTVNTFFYPIMVNTIFPIMNLQSDYLSVAYGILFILMLCGLFIMPVAFALGLDEEIEIG